MSFKWRILCAVLVMAVAAFPAHAWNFSGHWVVAAIAYDRLTPAARMRVDELIRAHPDYRTLFLKDAPPDSAMTAKYAFIRAASWPDEIRNDPRLYDEAKADAVPTPPLAGFPDTKRHFTWHYFDIPFSQDGTPVLQQEPPHLMSELPRLIGEIGTVDQFHAAYDLPWLLHLVGDSHQPLHSTTRFSQSQPKGDQGGNLAFVPPGRTLHSLWDDAGAQRDIPYDRVLNLAIEYAARLSAKNLSTNPQDWINESFDLVKSDVYTFGPDTGTKEHPLTLPSGYEENAKQIAQRRIAEAGIRLADVLNERLK